MNMKLLNKEENKITFLIKDINASLANAVRRSIMEEVPVMAIEEVTFVKNTSALYDEIIAHRLGLTPLSTDIKGYNLKLNSDFIIEKLRKRMLIFLIT